MQKHPTIHIIYEDTVAAQSGIGMTHNYSTRESCSPSTAQRDVRSGHQHRILMFLLRYPLNCCFKSRGGSGGPQVRRGCTEEEVSQGHRF